MDGAYMIQKQCVALTSKLWTCFCLIN